MIRLLLSLVTTLVAPMLASAATSLSIGELEPSGVNQATGSVPVVLRSDVPVSAVQMDVLFDPSLYTSSAAQTGDFSDHFKVESHVLSPGVLRVVVHSSDNQALSDGAAFRVPLAALDPDATTFVSFPVVLTNFLLASDSGTQVPSKLAPSVRLKSLTQGDKINGSSGLILQVETRAGEDGAQIARVEFYIGGQKAGESTSDPAFNFLWQPPASGPFEITAVAYDNQGLQAASRVIPIVITHVGTTAVKALYIGLIRSNPDTFSTTGSIQFSTTAKGAFTGKLNLGGVNHSATGQFDSQGIATVQVKRKGLKSLTLSLQQNGTDLADSITGTLTDGTYLAAGGLDGASFISELQADRVIWDKKLRPAPQAGAYTLILPSSVSSIGQDLPKGDGYAVVQVTATGAVTATGSLADGTKFSQASWLSKVGRWPLHAPLYAKKGAVTGELAFREVMKTSDLDGALLWSRPPQPKATAFKPGFVSELDAVGSRYTVPAPLERVLALANVAGNALLGAEEGSLSPPLEKLLTVTSANAVTVPVPATDKLKLALKAKTGLFSGSFIHPITKKSTAFSGALLQKQNLGSGFFLAGTLSGRITIDPNPAFAPGSGDGDPQGIKPVPVVAFKTPASEARIHSPTPVTIAGTAADKQGIAAVYYQVLYNNEISAVAQAEGSTNWSIPLDVSPQAGGRYTVFVKAVDEGGSESDVLSRSFTYVVMTDLIVAVQGPGSVTKDLLGTTAREMGASYTITATPQKGKVFKGWSGSVVSVSPKITFTMSPGFVLQANFE